MPMHQLSTIPIDAELLIDDFQRRVVEAYEAEFERLVEQSHPSLGISNREGTAVTEKTCCRQK